MPLQFVVPSQLDYLGFKLKWKGAGIFQGEKVQNFELAPSGLLGLVASGLDVSYADKDRSLRSFSGLTNLRDLSGDNYEANISFARADVKSYENASAMNAAQNQGLVTSCSAP